MRLDVVAVTFAAAGRPVVEHYQNAFDSPLRADAPPWVERLW